MKIYRNIRKDNSSISLRVMTVVMSFMLAFTMIPWVAGIQLQAYADDNVCYYTDSWTSWSTTKPTGSAPYESRTEYRYRDKSTTTTRSNSNSGWTLEKSVLDSSWSWGSWSGYSTTKYTASESTTKKREVQSKTQYNYSRYAQNSNNSGQLGPCKGTWSGIYCQYYFEKGWSDTKLAVHSTQYSNQMGGNFNLYGDGGQWFNQTTRTVYRYRDGTKGYTYYWYKWGSWSSWSATSASSSSTRDVQTRTTYRSKVPAGHSWGSGQVTKAARYTTTGTKVYTCSTCGHTKTETIPKLNSAPVKPAKAKIVSAKVAKRKLTVKWNRIAKKTVGYQVSLKNKKTGKITYYNAGQGKKAKLSKTIKKLTKNNVYAVRIRAFNVVNGEKIYGDWSNVKSGKVK